MKPARNFERKISGHYEIPPIRSAIEPVKPLLSFGLKQLVVVWTALVGLFLVVFLMGFHAGREQGVHVALEGFQEGQNIKLPISREVSEPERGALDSITSEVKGSVSEEEPKEFDFSKAAASLKAKSVAAVMEPPIEKVPAENIPAKKVGEAPSKKPIKKAAKIETPDIDTSKSLPKGWYVQLAATENRTQAKEFLARLKDSKLKGHIQQARIKEKQYFRVLSGPYQNRSLADKNRKKIESLSISRGRPFVKRVSS